MKKFFLLLVLCVLAAVLVISSAAAGGNCGAELEWTLDDNGTLTVFGKGEMTEYGFGKAPWADLEYTAVVIEDGVTSVCEAAFYGSATLKTVNLGADVTALGIAFIESCSALEAVEVSADNAVYSSADGVLFDKAKTTLILYPSANTVTDYTVPSGVSKIEEYAFYGAADVNSIIIPNSVTEIGTSAFVSCRALETIVLSESLTVIPDGMCNFCTSLKEVVIPDGVASIESRAFANCSSLAKLVIPDSVTDIEDGAIMMCDNLTVYCSENSAAHVYATMNGIPVELSEGEGETESASGVCGEKLTWSFDSESGTLTITGEGAMTEYEIGEAPWAALEIKTLSIGDGVTDISAFAFYETASLSEVIFCTTLTEIGESAFAWCTSLTSVNLPSSLRTVGNRAFNASGLVSVTIPESVTLVDDYAFNVCEKLTSAVFIGKNTEIGENAFYGCGTALEDGSFVINCYSGSAAHQYATANGITADLFAEDEFPSGTCGNGLTWTFDSVANRLYISGSGRMSDYSNKDTFAPWNEYKNSIMHVVIGDGVTYIGEWAFYNHISCRTVTFGENLETVGDSAFYGCTSLNSLEFNGSLRTIGAYAFNSCSALERVVCGEKLENVGFASFAYCRSIRSFTVRSTDVEYDEAVVEGETHTPFEGVSMLATFSCYKGSTTDAFATEYGFGVEYLEDETTEPSEPVEGDTNGDGKFDLSDCFVAIDALLGGEMLAEADMDKDGKITLVDIIRLIKKTV